MANRPNINKSSRKPKILVVPLDWGLGHATRCIPLIQALERVGAEVIIAAEGATASLLSAEFPRLQFLPLPGYRIRYARSKSLFALKLVSQLPRIFFALRAEKKWLAEAIKTLQLDAVISDNRPGLYSSLIPSVYITHQLYIFTGRNWMDALAQKLHYRFINRFPQCWVPDNEMDGLAGKLSHPQLPPKVPVKYLGLLSRFIKAPAALKKNVLILLSGPEPQRTIFENIILRQLSSVNLPVVLLRGLPGMAEPINQPLPSSVTIHNHLPASALNELLSAATYVIARGGYSTLMDLCALGKKAIIVPTPGQTEQEYLADYTNEKGFFISMSQDQFSFTDALAALERKPLAPALMNSSMLDEVIADFVNAIPGL